MQLRHQDALLVAVRAEALLAVFAVECRADAVALRTLGADVRHVGGAGAHGGQRHGVVVLGDLRFDHGEGLGVEPRAAGRPVAIARPAHFHLRVVDHLAHLVEELLLVFVRMQPHVERGLRFRRNDVVAEPGRHDRGHERGVGHRPVPRLVHEHPVLGRAMHLRIGIEQVAILLRHRRLGQGRELLEVRGRRLVEPQRRLPRADLPYRRCHAQDGAVLVGHRAMAGRAGHDQLHRPWFLLGRADVGLLHLAARTHDATAFGQAELRVDRVEVVVHHELRAHVGGAFLTGLGQQNHVAVERGIGALQLQDQHQPGDQVVLVVNRAAAIDVAAVDGGAKRRERPLLGVDRDDVGVSQHEDRLLLAVALDAHDQVRPRGVFREYLIRDALGVEHLLQVLHRPDLVAWRAAGVALQQRLEMRERFRFEGRRAGAALAVRQGDGTNDSEGREQDASEHAAMLHATANAMPWSRGPSRRQPHPGPTTARTAA